MGIGPKIKEFRTKSGLTQKELADKLHVTYQAVSRWENDDAEPSFDMLKDLCLTLDCTTDQLFEIEKPQAAEKEEAVCYEPPKQFLAVCESCNHPIYESDEIHRVKESRLVRHGRTSHSESYYSVLCPVCYHARKKQLQEKAEKYRQEKAKDFKKQRIKAFVWAGVGSLLFFIGAFVNYFSKHQPKDGTSCLVFGIFFYIFLTTAILDNTFITELWLNVASWGIKLPDIIFEFSLDGLIFLIVVKILFWLIGVAVSIFATVFATLLCMALSVFLFPIALSRNLRNVDPVF